MFQKFKYILRIITICIISFIIICSVILLSERQHKIESFYQIGKNYTNQVSIALHHWINQQIGLANTVAKDYRIINALKEPENIDNIEKATDYLKEIQKEFTFYENISLVTFQTKEFTLDINGERKFITKNSVITDTVNGTTVGVNYSNTPFVSKIRNGQPFFISDVHPSIYKITPIFVISVPIIEDDVIIGALLLEPQMDYFIDRFIDDFRYENTGYLFFGDERSYIIAHPNREYILKKVDNSDAIFNKIRNKEYFFKYTFNEIPKHYVATKLNINKQNIQSEWYIGFTQNDDEIFMTSNKLLLLMIAMLILFSSIITTAMYLFAKIIENKTYEDSLVRIKDELEIKVKERTNRLKILAITDGLTKLLNHTAVLKELKQSLEKADLNNSSIMVIMLDLDNFKKVNDTYGHLVGDEVLIEVSSTILKCIESNDIAGRYGGEEFVIILNNKDKVRCTEIAENIREAISLIKFCPSDLKVTASLGCFYRNKENSTEIIRAADQLLYLAKSNGKNRIEIN